jgi:PAS domain S-box-containing protein
MNSSDKTKEQLVSELAELRRSEEQHRHLLDEMSDGYIITQDGRIVFVNRRMAEMLACSVDELLGQPWRDFVELAMAEYIDQTPMEDLPPLLDVQAQLPDGSVLAVELAVRPAIYGGELAEFTLVRDVSERKRMENLTREQRDLGIALSATSRLDEALRLCVEAAISVSGMESGGIYVIGAETQALELAFHKGLAPNYVKSASHYDANSAFARLVMAGQPVYADYRELSASLEQSHRFEDLRAFAIVPVHHHRQIVACLNVASHSVGQIPSIARNALEATAAQIGSAIARLEAEKALHQSQERKFRSIVEHSRDGVILLDERGAVVEWNRGQEQITGLKREQALARPLWDVQFQLLPEQRQGPAVYAEFRANVLGLLKDGQPPRLSQLWEYEVQRSDGACRTVQESVFPIKTGTGFMAGCICRDVTALKQAEEALRESEERYRFLIEKQGEGISIVNAEEQFTFCNQVAEEIFGVPPGKLVGTSLKDFTTPESFDVVRRQTERRRAGERDTYEIEIVRPDGEKRQLLVTSTPWLDKDGQFIGSFAIFRDDTGRKQTEKRLRLLSSAVEQSSEGVAVSDLAGALLFINKAFANEHGYEPDELVGEHLSIFHTPEQMPSVEAANEQILKNGEFSDEIWHTRRDGSVFPALMHNSLLRDEAGDAIAMIGTLRNITERKQTEETLRRRNLELALLHRVSQALISTLDLDRMLAVLLNEMHRLLGVVACSVWLTDSQTGGLVCRQATGPKGTIVRGQRLPPGQGIAGWVADHGQSLIVPDAQSDPRHYKELDHKVGSALHSFLNVPLRATAGVIGVLQALDTEVNYFKTADLSVMEPLAATAAMAIENARLYEQARRDAETRAVLLSEVNHRVKNNLSAIIGLLYAARRYVEIEDQPVYQSMMDDLVNRVRGLTTAHSMLSASQWSPLRLSELTTQVVRSALWALPQGKRTSLEVVPSAVRVTPDQASNLALVINELATNTAKYALAGRDAACIIARIALDDDTVVFEFRDDGPGYPEELLRLERHSVGFDLIQNIVRKNLHGELALHNDHGAVTVIRFKTGVKDAEDGK